MKEDKQTSRRIAISETSTALKPDVPLFEKVERLSIEKGVCESE